MLTNKGSISKMQADQRALAEYAEFNRTQKIESDFDRVLKATKALGDKSQKSVRNVRGSKKMNALAPQLCQLASIANSSVVSHAPVTTANKQSGNKRQQWHLSKRTRKS